MRSLGQGGGKGYHRVFLSHETHLERLSPVNLCHEIAALGFCHHLQTGPREAGVDLYTGESKAGTHRVVEADTSDVLDVLVCGVNDFSLDREGRGGIDHQGQYRQQGKQCDAFHKMIVLVFACKNTKNYEL